MRRLKLAALLVLVMSLQSWGMESLVRVPISSKAQLLQLVGSGLDVAYVAPEKFVDVVADSGEIALLQLWGFTPFVAVPDLQAQGAGLLGALMGGYHTYVEVKAFLDSVAAARPDLVSPVFSLGLSLEGREIWGIKISNNPNGNDGRPEVFYNALTHAREPGGMEVLLYTIKYLLQNYGTDPLVTSLVNGRALYFVPVVNPDGYVYNQAIAPGGGGLWRKNRRPNTGGTFGVDLNRNFGYQWGYPNGGSSSNPGSDVYRGTAPFSEPESQKVRDFVLSRNFSVEVHYHTYSNLWLYPWGYTTELPQEEYWVYRAMADSAVQYNNYLASLSWQLYFTNGTSIDWSYGGQLPGRRVYAFTPEVGGPSDGFWPPASRIPALNAENLMPNLFMAWAADNPRKIVPPEPPAFLAADSMVSDGSAELVWAQADAGNLAADYLLKMSTGPQIATDSARNSNGWELVDFTRAPSPDGSGDSVFSSGARDAMVAAMSSRIPYLVKSNDTLKFEAWYDIETGFDYAYVEVSTDGGKTFSPIPGNLSTSTGAPYNHGNGITGSSGGAWSQGLYPLGSFAGRKVRFRFSYFTDGGFVAGGIYLRNIRPALRFAKDTVLTLPADSNYTVPLDSMGAYYFSVAAVDSQNQVGRFSDWTSRTATFSSAFFDLTGDGLATAADVVVLLNYVYLGILPPCCSGRADVNHDGILTSADVVNLMNFVFLGIIP